MQEKQLAQEARKLDAKVGGTIGLGEQNKKKQTLKTQLAHAVRPVGPTLLL